MTLTYHFRPQNYAVPSQKKSPSSYKNQSCPVDLCCPLGILSCYFLFTLSRPLVLPTHWPSRMIGMYCLTDSISLTLAEHTSHRLDSHFPMSSNHSKIICAGGCPPTALYKLVVTNILFLLYCFILINVISNYILIRFHSCLLISHFNSQAFLTMLYKTVIPPNFCKSLCMFYSFFFL